VEQIADHPNVQAVEAALRAAGVAVQVRVLPETAPTAAAAARLPDGGHRQQPGVRRGWQPACWCSPAALTASTRTNSPLCSAWTGWPASVFPTTFAQLVKATGAQPVAVN
jgi:hypothetical protein